MVFNTTSFSGSGGTVSNITVQKKGSAYHSRTKVSPRKTRTVLTTNLRQLWAQYSYYWTNLLPDDIKANWIAWAAAWPYANGLGPRTKLSGFQWYCRNNYLGATYSSFNTPIYDPGEWTRPTPLIITKYNYNTSLNQTEISGAFPDGAPIDGGYIWVYGQNPYLINRKMYPSQKSLLVETYPAFDESGITFDTIIPAEEGPFGPPWTSQGVWMYGITNGNVGFPIPFTVTVDA